MIVYIVIIRFKFNLLNENFEEVVVVGCVLNLNFGEKKIKEFMY